MSTNLLTERLLAEGYTKDDHPDYVQWSAWKNFEYTSAALREMVWETPCGLLIQGNANYNHVSQFGVEHCPENDNPLKGCPYFDEVICPHRLPTPYMGVNCIVHGVDRPYDYELSAEKIFDQWETVQHKAFLEANGGEYCACLYWDRPNRRYDPRYDPEMCINYSCKREVCAVTRRPRDLQRVNIYYDVLRTWRTRKGFAETVEREIEKGVRVFKKAVARTDAEKWLKMNRDELSRPKTQQEHRDVFFSEHYGKTGFGEYAEYEFTRIPQNIRIECRESRDLLQDLQDVKEGIEVIHACDIVRKKAEDKRIAKAKRQEAKARKLERTNVAKWKQVVEGSTQADDVYQDWARKQLAKRGLADESEQLSMFS